MEANIQIFKNSQFGEVRVTEMNGELHFVAKDVAERLGYNWQRNLVGHVPEEWKGVNPINTPSGIQEVITLSEQGLYFFLARSDKPAALPFQKWIAGEVIPSIRKHGGYLTLQKIEEVLFNPDTIIQLATNLKEEQQKRIAAEGKLEASKQQVQILKGENEIQQDKIKVLAPKADYTDQVLQSTSTYTTTQMAKELGISSAKALNKRLHEIKIMFNQSGQWLLYADYCGKGYTDNRTHKFIDEKTGQIRTNTETVWTEKGRMFLHDLFDKTNRGSSNKQAQKDFNFNNYAL